jgi:N-acetylglucosamine-6-phosphate deacetylase
VTAPFALVGEALLPEGRRRAGVVVRDGRIEALALDPRDGDLPAERRAVRGVIAPGFVDLQVNGAFGADVGVDASALETISRELPRTGVTAYLPTAISWPLERYAGLFEALERAGDTPGARILGVHLEGPFLAPTRHGAHDPENLRAVDRGVLEQLLSSGRVRVMTLAPELPGALEAIELIAGAGAVASAGHTEATYDEVVRAADAGLTLGTHLFNAMSPLGHREPGPAGALLSDERLRTGIIADGIHVHPAALRIAHRAKGTEGLVLVTDAMQAAGMPDGTYALSGRRVNVADGAARLDDGTLAGATATMDEVIRRAQGFLGLSLEETIRMATRAPAQALGLDRVGQIAPGAEADLVVLGADGVVEETLVAGEPVYRREAAPP